MDGFSKVFKNTVVLYVDSRVEFLHRVGISLRVDRERSLIEIYREEGSVFGGRSSSKGKRTKVRFRGRPTLEGVCRLLPLKLEDSRILFFSISEVFLRSSGYATLTQEVAVTEFFLELPSGRVLKSQRGKDPEIVGELRPAKDLWDFLDLTVDLWRLVDRTGLPQ